MSRFYSLGSDGRTPTQVRGGDWSSLPMWGNDASRRVGLSRVGRYTVSTVFLGFDMKLTFVDDDPPILFETMIFDNDADDDDPSTLPRQWRYSTWDKAWVGHVYAVNVITRLNRMRARRTNGQ